MKTSRRLGRNDLCFCESGKKYKHCHLSRATQEPFSNGRLLSGLRKTQRYLVCLHPDSPEGCKQGVIKAHSIQKGGPIRCIADSENHVYCFDVSADSGSGVSRVGWAKASVFQGFCGKHDAKMFSPVEDFEFVASAEQCFLTGYRSFSFELYRKRSALQGISYIRDNADRGHPNFSQLEFQFRVKEMKDGYQRGVSELERTLSSYSSLYKSQNHSNLQSLVISFEGRLDVVVTGAFAAEFDMDGNRLQTLSRNTYSLQSISVSTVVCQNGYALVFTWLPEYNLCADLAESLLKLNREHLSSRVIELLFAYLENIYFSDVWLDSLSEQSRKAIEGLARMPTHYGSPLAFSGNSYVDWNITNVCLSRGL